MSGTNVKIIAGSKVVLDTLNEVKAIRIDQAKEFKPIASGALPTIPASPANQDYKMYVSGGKTGSTFTGPGLPGGSVALTKSERGTLWFDKDTRAWSLLDVQELPIAAGTTSLQDAEIPKGIAVKEYVGVENIKLRNDLIDFQFGKPVDLEIKPALTNGYFINRLGNLATTVATTWSATEGFVQTRNAKKLEYFGDFGSATTSLAFYRSPYVNTFISSIPLTDGVITNSEFDIPNGANYFRVTCRVTAQNNFKIILKGVITKTLNLQSFRIAPGVITYQNDAVKQANIIWNDGSTGVVTYDNWNSDNLTFTSFVATSIENGVSVAQPQVTFNASNQITNYPNFIISQIV